MQTTRVPWWHPLNRKQIMAQPNLDYGLVPSSARVYFQQVNGMHWLDANAGPYRAAFTSGLAWQRDVVQAAKLAKLKPPPQPRSTRSMQRQVGALQQQVMDLQKTRDYWINRAAKAEAKLKNCQSLEYPYKDATDLLHKVLSGTATPQDLHHARVHLFAYRMDLPELPKQSTTPVAKYAVPTPSTGDANG